LGVFATLGLELLEADGGAVELAFDGSHVAQEAVKAGVAVRPEEIPVDPEGLGFAARARARRQAQAAISPRVRISSSPSGWRSSARPERSWSKSAWSSPGMTIWVAVN
jgi:hypothetical protein